MYHSLASECQTQFVCRQPANVVTEVRRTQFRFTATRSIHCLNQDFGFFHLQPTFDLFISRHGLTGLALKLKSDQPHGGRVAFQPRLPILHQP